MSRRINPPPQHQDRHPGIEAEMKPLPEAEDRDYRGTGRLQDKVVLITGGDSGIGRAVVYLFAKEGADSAVIYLNEDVDAEHTKNRVEEIGRRCLLIRGDIQEEEVCKQAVERTVEMFGRIDILINNAAVQYPRDSIEEIRSEELERTFRTNIIAMFYLTKAALRHMKEGSAIINNASVTAYKGFPQLLDYSSTQGAVVTFTRSLSQSLVQKGIRVNAVAPGPIWTPLIPSSFSADMVSKFDDFAPMERAGQPREVAPSFLFLASDDSIYMTGQVLHPNGGTVVNG
jgi:NAD(P)-dependent dehydrogenase (short-subunit alcohol dehydrogenase family)